MIRNPSGLLSLDEISFFIFLYTQLSSSLLLQFTMHFCIFTCYNTIIGNRLISFRAVLSNRTLSNCGNSLHMHMLLALGSLAQGLVSFLPLPAAYSSQMLDFRVYSSCVVEYIFPFPLRMVIVLGKPFITVCFRVSLALRHKGPGLIKMGSFAREPRIACCIVK